MGLSQALHRADPGPRGQRDRAPRRPPQRGAHPALRRRQPGFAARHLSRRGGARRVRPDEPASLGRGDPPGARRPRGLGDLHRHAQGAQRVLAQVPRRARRPRLVRGAVPGVGDRHPARGRARRRAPRHDRGGVRTGVRMLLRGGDPGRLLRQGDGRGAARRAHPAPYRTTRRSRSTPPGIWAWATRRRSGSSSSRAPRSTCSTITRRRAKGSTTMRGCSRPRRPSAAGSTAATTRRTTRWRTRSAPGGRARSRRGGSGSRSPWCRATASTTGSTRCARSCRAAGSTPGAPSPASSACASTERSRTPPPARSAPRRCTTATATGRTPSATSRWA